MGFYIRKSVRVGGIRFNLSKSGIGASTGIKGFRVGSGPRGNYIHMGRGGLYYRAALPSNGSGSSYGSPLPTKPATDSDGLTEIESGSVTAMVDSSATELLQELNAKRRKWRIWPWLLLGSLLGAPQVSGLGVDKSVAVIVMMIGLFATPVVGYWDRMRRTTVLLYDLEDDAVSTYQELHDAFADIVSAARRWHLSARGATADRKRNAGATNLVRRSSIVIGKKPPTTLRTNIEVLSIPVGRQTLCFLPDRLLIFDSSGVGAIPYGELTTTLKTTRFIEEETAPSDAQVVGHTWKFVNKSGGPDKRFKNNRQLPICLYSEIEFTSGTGLREVIQASRSNAGGSLASAIRAQGASESKRRAPELAV